ncbi:hypothetical protein N7462_010042 [Penicillium macrosclerotiorum]|uniref:uncharacterized protein n=1 Tax=Penicillium macrosclerotiorum TaxID=303699 RepID=UPI0025486FFC|nr:uncharacterized protein N7462_010042 [Penicillium macrosclerotiorum]KAJ5668972.1 hypothetical protein N7462_010042 [Penicillium macrosclerotiorum]
MNKAINTPITPVRLGEKLDRAPLKTGATVDTIDKLSEAAVLGDETRVEDTLRVLVPVALEVASTVVDSAAKAPTFVERLDSAPAFAEDASGAWVEPVAAPVPEVLDVVDAYVLCTVEVDLSELDPELDPEPKADVVGEADPEKARSEEGELEAEAERLGLGPVELEVAELEAGQDASADWPDFTVNPETMTVPPEPLHSTKMSTISEESAARQAVNGAEDPASTTVVEITCEPWETYRVQDRVSRFRVAEVSVTDTVPETALVESSVSTDTLAAAESPSVVLPLNVDVPSSSVVIVPVDAVQAVEVVEEAVVETGVEETAVVPEDSVLTEDVMVLRASVGIRLSSLVVDESVVVGVALEDAGVVAEDASLGVVAANDDVTISEAVVEHVE